MNKKYALVAVSFFLLGFLVALSILALYMLQNDGKSGDGQRLLPDIIFPVQPRGNDSQLIGGDRDEHGCLIGGGYSWCETSQKCIRQWEEPCGGSGSVPSSCQVQNCHGVDIECGFGGGPKACTEMYTIEDVCLPYAQCEVVEGRCQQKENPKFNSCKECIRGCQNNERRTLMPEDIFQCAESCK